MGPALTEVFGNASSIHGYGQQARALLDQARRDVAEMLQTRAEEIVFTSGGTEADNTALFGAGADTSGHVITTAVEHPAILQACGQLASVTIIPVDGRGTVDPDDIRNALRPNTRLISVMHVNNELGVIQPVEGIARIAREAGILFHSDGVQAAGRIPLNLPQLGPDLYSISAHKIYGPKGMGALYVKKGTPLRPLLQGGPQERKLRAGTGKCCRRRGSGPRRALGSAGKRDRKRAPSCVARPSGTKYFGSCWWRPRKRRGRTARRQYFQHSLRWHRQRTAFDCAGPEGLCGFERFGLLERCHRTFARAGGHRSFARTGPLQHSRFARPRQYARTSGRARRRGVRLCRPAKKVGAGVCLTQAAALSR